MKKKQLYSSCLMFLSLFATIVFLFVAMIGRFLKKREITKQNINVVWGTTSLTNYKHWSNALVSAGWKSKAVVGQLSHHSSAKDFDKVIFKQLTKENNIVMKLIFQSMRNFLHFVFFFITVLLKTNLIVHSCEGLIFYHYNRGLFNYKVELLLLRLAKVRIAVIPYGGDAHVYRRIRNPHWLAGLLQDYPQNSRIQNKVAKRVDFYVEKADLFLPGSAILDGFGRSDRISANTLCIDTKLWSPLPREKKKHLVITHAPNHRKVKGTQSILNSVTKLIEQGYDIELILIEGKSNEEVRETLQNLSDIHIDQLNSDSYALSAIEAMALGIPTISSYGGAIRDFFSEWSFSGSCPIINANSKNLAEILQELIINEDMRLEIATKSRDFVLSYHSYEYFANFFVEALVSQNIIKSVV